MIVSRPMGSSLADRAWGRDSAVYRITGVLTVIAGWLLTGVAACLAALVVVLIMAYGGTWGMIAMLVIAGALLTAVIQSSSASVGILQALSATGQVSYGAAVPIIMGQNIGTCVTALLSAIGAKTNAKRAALVHLYFNLVGTLVFMLAFYGVNAFVDFAFLDTAATPAGIATVHTCFNVVATILLLPFSKLLEKLACLTVKEKKDPSREKLEQQLQLQHLDLLQILLSLRQLIL